MALEPSLDGGKMKRILLLLLVVTASSAQAEPQFGPLTGTYKYKTEDADNQVAILDVGNGTLKFNFFGSWPHINGDGEKVAHIGEISGEIILKGSKALFASEEYEDCKLLFTFSKERVAVEQLGERGGWGCGFGTNVEADGQYRRVSRQKPKVQGW